MQLIVLRMTGIGPEFARMTLAIVTGKDDALLLALTLDTTEIGFAGLATDIPG